MIRMDSVFYKLSNDVWIHSLKVILTFWHQRTIFVRQWRTYPWIATSINNSQHCASTLAEDHSVVSLTLSDNPPSLKTCWLTDSLSHTFKLLLHTCGCQSNAYLFHLFQYLAVNLQKVIQTRLMVEICNIRPVWHWHLESMYRLFTPENLCNTILPPLNVSISICMRQLKENNDWSAMKVNWLPQEYIWIIVTVF